MTLTPGIRTVLLWFYLGERALEATGYWRIAGTILGAALAETLARLVHSDDEALLVTPGPGADETRTVADRSVRLHASDAIYLDYVVTRRSKNFAFCRERYDLKVGDVYWTSGEARLFFEPPPRSLSRILRKYWGWGFQGYVLNRGNLDLLPALGRPPDEIPRGIERAEVYFEECYDQAGLRLWTTRRTQDHLLRDIGLDKINRQLARVHIPRLPKSK
jgi:hypothetical protein